MDVAGRFLVVFTISSWYLWDCHSHPLAGDCIWGYCLLFMGVGLRERSLVSLKGWYYVCLYRGISFENSIKQSLGMAGHLTMASLTYFFFFFFFLSPEVKGFKNRIYTDFYCSSYETRHAWSVVKMGRLSYSSPPGRQTGIADRVSACFRLCGQFTHGDVAGLWTVSGTLALGARMLS